MNDIFNIRKNIFLKQYSDRYFVCKTMLQFEIIDDFTYWKSAYTVENKDIRIWFLSYVKHHRKYNK